jgi:hypothetical protein
MRCMSEGGGGGCSGAIEPAGEQGTETGLPVNGPNHVTYSEIIHIWLLEHRPIETVP